MNRLSGQDREFFRTVRLCHLYVRDEGMNRDPNGRFGWLNPTCQELARYRLLLDRYPPLTRTRSSRLANPITVRTPFNLLNDALRAMYHQLARGVDTIEIMLAGEGDPANQYMMDVEDIRTQIATSLLEIKRQYQDVTFAEIQFFQTRGKDLPEESTEKPDFQLRYKVSVGPLHPHASESISTPIPPLTAALAAEKATLPAYLSPQSLDYFFHEMPDTGEGGTPGWVLAFHQGGTDDEFDALVAQHVPEARDDPVEMERLRALFNEFQDELAPPSAAAAATTTT